MDTEMLTALFCYYVPFRVLPTIAIYADLPACARTVISTRVPVPLRL